MKKVLFLQVSNCIHFIGKICFLMICCCVVFTSEAFPVLLTPDTLISPNASIPVNGTLLTADKLQQCYVVTTDNSLLKYNKDGQLLFQYNNNRLGTLTWVDATDPFNVLLFYPEYFTVVLLDRTLSITGEYQLYDLNITDVKVVAMANDNNLWLFDDNTGKLKKISRAGEILEESVNTKLLLEKKISPNALVAVNNKVYLNDPEVGVLVFDNFGTYLNKILVTGLKAFQIVDKQLLYQNEAELFAFHLESLLTSAIALPFKLEQNDQLTIQKGVLFRLKPTALLIYQMN